MRRTSQAWIGIATVLSTAAVLACGAGARSFDGSVYRDGPVAFQIAPVPSGWRAVEVDGASLAYRDEAHRASILVNARCRHADEGTPLTALTNHLLMGSTERDVLSQQTEPFDAREALHTKLRAKWDGVPMAFDVYVMKKDGCTYDFAYMGDPTGSDEGTGDFERFARAFRTLPGSGVVGGGKR